MEYHRNKLSSLCRLCGEKLNTKFREIALYKEDLDELYDLNIEFDHPDIHPKYICSKCWKCIDRSKEAKSKGRDFQPRKQIVVSNFKTHDETLCNVCKPKTGRKSKICKLPGMSDVTEKAYCPDSQEPQSEELQEPLPSGSKEIEKVFCPDSQEPSGSKDTTLKTFHRELFPSQAIEVEITLVDSFSLDAFANTINAQVFLCTVCQGVPKPNSCISETTCGHMFCQACISQWFKFASTCPTCKSILDLTDVSQLKGTLFSLYENLEINCSFAGCNIITNILSVEKHEESCKFRHPKKVFGKAKQSLYDCHRWYVKSKRLKELFCYVNDFCESNNESKIEVMHVLLRETLLEKDQKSKAEALDSVMQEKPTQLDVDTCLSLRISKLQTKNQYRAEYEKINAETGRKILQAPNSLDTREKCYVPPSARWTLISQHGQDQNLHHTPAKIKRDIVTHSARGSDFEPLNILEDFPKTLPELPTPNCKGVRWNYVDAVAKTLEELDFQIVKGLESKGLDSSDTNLLFTVVIKDGADGMGDIERHMEKSDRFLPDKAFRFSFAIVSITTTIEDEQVNVFDEPNPSSVRVNRPLLVAIADENYRSSCIVLMSSIEYEREYMKAKELRVHIPESALQRSYKLKFYTSMVDEKFDRSEGGLASSGSKYLCTLCHANRDNAKCDVGSFCITRTFLEIRTLSETVRSNPDKLDEKSLKELAKGVSRFPVLLSEPKERGIDATHADINLSSFFKSIIIREVACVNKWEATSDIKYLIDDAAVKLDLHIKQTVGLNPALMMPGNYARHMFDERNENHFLHLIADAAKRQNLSKVFAIFRCLRKIYRAVKPIQDYPDEVKQYKEKAVKMASLLKEHFPYVPFTNYLHKIVEHIQELIEDPCGPGSIGAMCSEGNEGGNKIFRQLRKGHARKGNTYDGIRDVLWQHWLYTSPKLCHIGDTQAKQQMCSNCYSLGHNRRTCGLKQSIDVE